MSAIASSRRRRAGFSLIEILVAMTLTGLVLAAIAMVTAKWLPAWQRGLGRVQQSELVALALDRMAADLAAAAFLPVVRGGAKPLFDGSAERVVFVREVLAPGAARGLEIVELAPVPDGRGVAMVRRTAPYAPQAEGSLPPFGAPVRLLRPPTRVTFSYAGRDGTWHEAWRGEEELPRAVRMVVHESGRPTAASTAVSIRSDVPAFCAADVTKPVCGSSVGFSGSRAQAVSGAGANNGGAVQ
ncbi:type II secretion system protein J [Xanthobacter sp. YC-JY1]|uniref:PulJ/GspJ family protein n=1 Tax=Xanthobacter sp. YC-JY1 TaxID=2419844 RepID=UPI001F3AC356|nr:prepilin-type N-terminal cleavage/methylation domain-containing protein [Xanthobacter sp. YC-JY1]UJX45980.1 prepilin-type N-terminal cleavage/methylation domain-containing protein [Xanthobacter sp. YC-JY1]